ncbi:MAG: ABC transporter ATP-binding protein [Chloroflexi bacterium]|nr:ABC transporter ATP-binding protein [Chloroflexota bacterium]
MIEAEGLTKRYGKLVAVDHVSFSVQPGEIVGLLGPNGAGKTTTMRMLTGFMPPSEGTARVVGHDIIEDSMAARRAIGYMPERIPIYPDMTVRGYIAFWARLRGIRRPAGHVEAVLKRVDLYDRRDTLIRQLSKGMRQRLGLAQALVHEPEVVILDEPTIGIDPQQVIEVRESVRELGRKHAVLFSTHILTEAEQVCDRVLIINKGHIVAEGDPGELRQQLEPGTQLYVVIGGASADQAAALLSAIPGVISVEVQGEGFNVSTQAGTDIRGAVFAQVSAAGYSLLEIRAVASTLEDIFLNLVSRDSQAEGV